MTCALMMSVEGGPDVLQNLPWDVALKHLLDGTGALAEWQEEAPFPLLEILEARTSFAAQVGPETNHPERLQKVSETVFRNGLMQFVVEGHTLRCFDRKSDLMHEIETLASACPQKPANLYRQLRAVLTDRVRSASQTVYAYSEMSEETQLAQGLIVEDHKARGWELRPFVVVDVPNYKAVGPEWRLFYDRLVALTDAFAEEVDRCLASGRIICSERTAQGDRLLPPGKVQVFKNDMRRRKNISFVLSRDLPDAWFTDLSSLSARKKRAVDWINRIGTHFSGQGKRVASQDLKQIARDRFGLSENAISEVWSRSDFPTKGQKGAIRRDQRVSLSEIRGLE